MVRHGLELLPLPFLGVVFFFGKVGMGQFFPVRIGKRFVPNGLWLRSAEDKFAKTFQFFEATRVDQFVVSPRARAKVEDRIFHCCKTTEFRRFLPAYWD